MFNIITGTRRRDYRMIAMVALIWLLPQIDLAISAYEEFSNYMGAKWLLTPALATMLGMGGHGAISLPVLYLGLPIIILMLVADRPIRTKAARKASAGDTKLDDQAMRVRDAVLVSVVNFGGSLGLNLILAMIVFHNGRSFQGLTVNDANGIFAKWELTHSIAAILIRIILFLAVIAFITSVAVILSRTIQNYAIVYALTFILWMFMIQIGIDRVLQPFTEYSLITGLPVVGGMLLAGGVLIGLGLGYQQLQQRRRTNY
ncbi:hypothetical protein [Lactiplantibacillus pentosus]|uniref:hypothetical protein n=1 Tax=Lactiplantibacillus pentosus TaxID=1589 RepID=UPI0021823A83|nr:hypothetical protein [Lactiplantibacillus pentosus]MCT0162193.1 hypothetical protein [Lactiplantibacillus pentosus]